MSDESPLISEHDDPEFFSGTWEDLVWTGWFSFAAMKEEFQYFSKFTSVNFGKSSILSTSDQPNGRRTETNETNLSFFRIPSQTNSRKKSKRNKSSATVLGPR